MSTRYPISPPANYVAPTAVGFADAQGDLSLVTDEAPLPVATVRAAAPAPLAGQTGASIVAGPFAPLPDAPIHLLLEGEWEGEVVLQRSTDAGATRHALTAGGLPWARFTGNANEPVWQESERGTSFYLDIALSLGMLSYRVSQ